MNYLKISKALIFESFALFNYIAAALLNLSLIAKPRPISGNNSAIITSASVSSSSRKNENKLAAAS